MLFGHQPAAPRSQTHSSHFKKNLHWPSVNTPVEALVFTCITCQKSKLTAVKKFGRIPLPTKLQLKPWEEVHVDLISPSDIWYNSTSIHGESTIKKIQALTTFDKAKGWLEFVATSNKNQLPHFYDFLQ